VATQTQLLVQKEAETEAKRAVSEAEKRAAVATIELGKQLAEKQSMQRVEAIENDMHLARQKVAPMNRNPSPDPSPSPSPDPNPNPNPNPTPNPNPLTLTPTQPYP